MLGDHLRNTLHLERRNSEPEAETRPGLRARGRACPLRCRSNLHDHPWPLNRPSRCAHLRRTNSTRLPSNWAPRLPGAQAMAQHSTSWYLESHTTDLSSACSPNLVAALTEVIPRLQPTCSLSRSVQCKRD